MQKEKKDKHFIRKPHFEGGLNAMRKIIRENLRYPEEALNNKIEGTVVVKYAIDHLGKVTDAKVIAGIGHGCDEEAIRLVHLFSSRYPRTGASGSASTRISTSISASPAKKEKPKPPPAPTAFTYTITPEPADPKPEEKPAAGGYTITLNW
ncbi:MAG: TonB family protein [Saprospirales bacterium]|nr:TonB family protein [Saprospirales bacterium]